MVLSDAALSACAAALKEKFPASLLGAEEAHFFGPNDEGYMQFARRYDGSVTQASAAFQQTLDWRRSTQPHRINAEKDCPNALRATYLGLGGVGKNGDAVMTLAIAHPSYKAVSKDERVRLFVFALEELARRRKYTFLFISDFTLVGKEKDPLGAATRDETIQILEKHYPERCTLTYMYNPPWYISTFTPLSMVFKDSRTKEKLRGSCKTKDLLKDIDESQLPVAFGGKFVTAPNLVDGMKQFAA